MQRHRAKRFVNVWSLRSVALGFLLLALASNVPQAQGQLQFTSNGGTRSTIAGSVSLDGEARPAARVRVDVKALTGGQLATTFTDSAGRFEAPTEGAGSFIVTGQEQGDGPVEQKGDLGFGGSTPGVMITLHKVRATPADRAEGYTVSVHELKGARESAPRFREGHRATTEEGCRGQSESFQGGYGCFPELLRGLLPDWCG